VVAALSHGGAGQNFNAERRLTPQSKNPPSEPGFVT